EIASDGGNRCVTAGPAGAPLDHLFGLHFALEPVVAKALPADKRFPSLLRILLAVEPLLLQLGQRSLQGGALHLCAVRQRLDASSVLGAGVHHDEPVLTAIESGRVGAGPVDGAGGALRQSADGPP